jgi:hypothetical protein
VAIYDPTRLYETSTIVYDLGIYDGFSPAPGQEGPWQVLLSVDLSANGVGDWFTLDDPVKGVLDNPTYFLSGDLLVDVTGWVRSINAKRGRSRQLEKFTAGTCSVVLDNRQRLFDPTMAESPFFGSIVPRKQVVVSKNGIPVFSGNVQDWNFDYSVNGDSTATMENSDGFAFISQRSVPTGARTSQLTGARVSAILDAIFWPAGQRDIDTGSKTLTADTIAANTNALNYLQKVETSENGALFIGRDGNFTFKDSAARPFTGVTFGPAGVPFIDYKVVYGTEELWNRVKVTWASGTETAEDATSQDTYGVFETTYETLLSTNTAAQNLAAELLAQYKDPTYRVDEITVRVDGINSGSQSQVMSLELADKILVEWTPKFGGAISQYCSIDAISHRAGIKEHYITLTLSETTI